MKAVIDNREMNGHGSIPIKLSLWTLKLALHKILTFFTYPSDLFLTAYKHKTSFDPMSHAKLGGGADLAHKPYIACQHLP